MVFSQNWKRKQKFGLVCLGSVVLILIFSFSFFLYLRVHRRPRPLQDKFVIEETLKPTLSPETTPALVLAEPGEKVLLPGTKVAYQTFNNCGPATLAMILSYYGFNQSQKELGRQIRPYQHPRGDNDDKTVFPEEFVKWVEKFGLKALYRPNGSLQLIKVFLANEIPVVVKTLLRQNEDSAHFRIVRGFDDQRQVIIVDDSYFGPKRKISYFQFMTIWQPFNYLYLPVYPKEKEVVVETILGPENDPEVAYWRAINRAQKEAELDPENVYPLFNLVTSYYHVGRYQESVELFEKIESRLPRRMLWYQIEPLLAYKELGNDERVFQLSDWLFANGNRAFSELYQIRGEIYLKKGNREAAKREFELALEYNRNFEPAQKALLNF